MQTRTISGLGLTVSRLGFGAMRMPERDGIIDYAASRDMVDYLYDNGVNYFDTAYFYHFDQSESFLKKALVERHPRDNYILATKLPIALCREPRDMASIFEIQLGRLGVSRLDLYMLHGISAEQWARSKSLGAPEFLRRLKADGRIGFFGFSFHDKPEALAPILDDFPWDFCYIQINYADWLQRGSDIQYEAAGRRNVPIFVMEPVRGGGLARLPAEMQAIKDSCAPDVSPASWAFRFCAGLPHVDVVLSGMSSLEQCKENVRLFADPPPLGEDDLTAMRLIAEAFDRMPSIPCTSCRYCSACPQGIDIPTLFSYFNNYSLYQGPWELKHIYRHDTPDEHKATACTRCGACEDACPQKIPIMDKLAMVHATAVGLWE